MMVRTAETRKNPRIDVRLSAEVFLGRNPVTTTTRNLSPGGVCLEGVTFPEGTPLRIALFLVIDGVEDSIRAPLEMRGHAAWSSPSDGEQPALLGMRFEGLTPVETAGLLEFLKVVQE